MDCHPCAVVLSNLDFLKCNMYLLFAVLGSLTGLGSIGAVKALIQSSNLHDTLNGTPSSRFHLFGCDVNRFRSPKVKSPTDRAGLSSRLARIQLHLGGIGCASPSHHGAVSGFWLSKQWLHAVDQLVLRSGWQCGSSVQFDG